MSTKLTQTQINKIKKDGIVPYEQIGKVTSTETGTISGKDFEKVAKERRFYNEETGTYRLITRNKKVSLFIGEGRDIDELIKSDKDYRSMSRLIKSINSNNIVMYTKRKGVKAMPANRACVALMIERTEKKTAEFINSMKKLGIIKEEEQFIYVNPVYAMSTNGLNIETYIRFKDELDEVLPNAAVRDLQSIAYYEMFPEELDKEMEENDLTEEDVIAKARQYEEIDLERLDPIAKEIMELQGLIPAKETKVELTVNTRRDSLKEKMKEISKNSTSTIVIGKKPNFLKSTDLDLTDEPMEYDEMYG